MKNLLIISSTYNSNYQLSEDIKNYYKNNNEIKCSLISLEEFDLPLYIPPHLKQFLKKNHFQRT